MINTTTDKNQTRTTNPTTVKERSMVLVYVPGLTQKGALGDTISIIENKLQEVGNFGAVGQGLYLGTPRNTQDLSWVDTLKTVMTHGADLSVVPVDDERLSFYRRILPDTAHRFIDRQSAA